MNPAAKHFDPVLGIDVHMIQPPGPVPPVPVPHPFIGFVLDLFDYAPWIGSTVKVNGVHRAIAGTSGVGMPKHIPIGGAFVKPPSNECEMFMGSQTVSMDGDAASYQALPAMSCQCIGGPPVPRLWKKGGVKSLVLPLSKVVPIPGGPPVWIGGPPTISLFQIAGKILAHGLGKALKKFAGSKLGRRIGAFFAKGKQKLFGWMRPGFLKCIILKAEPVNVISGEVVFGAADFTLPGRLPLTWVRRYGSRNQRTGLCGHGWETPADGRLQLEPDGRVVFCDGGPGGAVFAHLPVCGLPERELVGGAELSRDEDGLVIRTATGHSYFFPMPRPGVTELLLEVIADPCGNRLVFERGLDGLKAVVFDDGRRVEAVSRGGRILRLALRHPDHPYPIPLVSYDYTSAGDLSAAKDAFEVPHVFKYDALHRLVKHTDRTGLSFRYEYDSEGRCVRTWGDGGLYAYAFDYLDAAGETWVTDSLGHVTVIQYDIDGFPVAEIDPLGRLTEYEYDAAGRTTAVTAPAARRTEFVYDEAGRLVRRVAPGGAVTELLYDDRRRPVGVVTPAWRTWRWERDRRGLIVQRTAPDGAVWQLTYNAKGDLVAVTDPLGATTRFDHDATGQVAATTDPLGRCIRFEYDARGCVAARFGPDGGRSQFEYDRKGRLVAAHFPGGGTARCDYDAGDNLTVLRNEAGDRTEFRRTGMGRVAAKISPDGAGVGYRYDTEDRLVAVVNERGETYRFEYDPLGRLARETDYQGWVWAYEYGTDGHLARRTDPLGQVTEYTHDARGRLTKRQPVGGPAERFVYDADGAPLVACNDDSTVKRTFDAVGRLVEEVQDGFAVATEYDPVGRTVRRFSGHGHDLRYEYDAAGGLVTVRLDGAELLTVERGGVGRSVRQRLGSGLVREQEFGPRGEVVRQRLTADGWVVRELNYRYDAAGRVLGLAGGDGEYTLEYDLAGRVRRAAGPDGQVRDYERDVAGTVLGTTPDDEFDAAGQLVRRGELRLSWDGLGRLAGATTADGRSVRFGYDAFGRRAFKEVDGVRTRFRWDGDRLLAEEPPVGLPREFAHAPGSFRPLALVADEVYHYDTGPAGLPLALLDRTGRAVWAAEPDALAGVGGVTAAAVDQPLRLLGQYFDAETGLCYNRHRYFDPAGGKFISPDPLGLLPGPDPYAYAPNVFNWTDPLGLAAKCIGPLVALDVAKEIYEKNPRLLELGMIQRGHLPAGALERVAAEMEREEGVRIVRMSEDEYRFWHGRGRENPAKLVGYDEIHIIDDVFAGPNGAREVAHEYGASKVAEFYHGPTQIPTVAGFSGPGGGPASVTHILDDYGGLHPESNSRGLSNALAGRED